MKFGLKRRVYDMKFVFESNTIRQIGLLMLTTLKWRMQVMLSSSLDKFGYGTQIGRAHV